jgi:hypothetical protein
LNLGEGAIAQVCASEDAQMKKLWQAVAVCSVVVGACVPAVGAPLCSSITQFSGLLSLDEDGCVSQDKIFFNFETDPLHNPLPGNTSVSVSFIIVGALDYHRLYVRNLLPGTYEFDYSIRVDDSDPANAGRFIALATAGVNVGFNPVTVHKILIDPAHPLTQYHLDTTGPNAEVNFSPWAKQIDTHVMIIVGAGGFANSVSDQYIQNVVPEPTTFALFGVSLIVLGALRFRRGQLR